MSELKSYFAQIEEHFIALRQRPLLLSPRDVQEIERWHGEGIPVGIVLRGMDRYFERIRENPQRLRRFASVLYCRNDILDLFERHLDQTIGASSGGCAAEQPAGDVLAGLDQALVLASQEAQPAQAEILEASRKSLSRLRRKAAGLAMEKLEASLERLERRLVKRMLVVMDAPQSGTVESRVRSELESYRTRLEPDVFEGLVRRGVQREVLARLNLPRFTLFV